MGASEYLVQDFLTDRPFLTGSFRKLYLTQATGLEVPPEEKPVMLPETYTGIISL